MIFVILVVLLSSWPDERASAAEQTAVIQVSITVPVSGAEVVGVLTLDYDDASGEGTWAFDGTIGGQPASGSGALGYASADDSATPGADSTSAFTLTLQSVETWEADVAEPRAPVTLGIEPAGEIVHVSIDSPTVDLFDIPFEMSPEPADPLSGTFVLSNVGDAPPEATQTQTLPSAGDRSGTSTTASALFAGAFAAAGALALVVGGFLVVRGCRQRPHGR